MTKLKHTPRSSNTVLVSCPDPPLAIKKRGNEKRARVGSGDETNTVPLERFRPCSPRKSPRVEDSHRDKIVEDNHR